jgi:hypothetical protein
MPRVVLNFDKLGHFNVRILGELLKRQSALTPHQVHKPPKRNVGLFMVFSPQSRITLENRIDREQSSPDLGVSFELRHPETPFLCDLDLHG